MKESAMFFFSISTNRVNGTVYPDKPKNRTPAKPNKKTDEFGGGYSARGLTRI